MSPQLGRGSPDRSSPHASTSTCAGRCTRTPGFIRTKDVVPELARVVTAIGSAHDERAQEAVLDPSEVAFLEVRAEDVGLDDKDVAELSEHLEAVADGRECESRDSVLVQRQVSAEGAKAMISTEVSCAQV